MSLNESSFIQTLLESFEAALEFQVDPENEAVTHMMNFIIENSDNFETLLGNLRAVRDLGAVLFNDRKLREIEGKVQSYYIMFYEDFSERFTCHLVTCAMMHHNLGDNVSIVLVTDDDGKEVRAIDINTVVMQELCEREIPYLKTLSPEATR